MPLTPKGKKIKAKMAETYGPEEGERVFYASKNKGKISGVDRARQEKCGDELASIAGCKKKK